MNYFAHSFRFLDNPYVLAGTSLPDWLSVVNRRARLRRATLIQYVDSQDERLRQLVTGVIQHLDDDLRFHNAPVFSDVLVQVLRLIQPVVNGRAVPLTFLAHLMTEVMFDAALLDRFPHGADDYYAALSRIDPSWVEMATEMITGQHVENLGSFIRLFCREGILHDYKDDPATFRRMNQVMARLRLPPLPSSFLQVLPRIRSLVGARENELCRALDG